MNIAAFALISCLGLIAFAKSMDRFVPIEAEPETGPYFDNVIQFPVRRQA